MVVTNCFNPATEAVKTYQGCSTVGLTEWSTRTTDIIPWLAALKQLHYLHPSQSHSLYKMRAYSRSHFCPVMREGMDSGVQASQAGDCFHWVCGNSWNWKPNCLHCSVCRGCIRFCICYCLCSPPSPSTGNVMTGTCGNLFHWLCVADL